MWKPRVFPDDARECQCPFVLFLHSPVANRRGVGAQRKWCWDSRCSPQGNPACRGTFGCRMKVVRYRVSLHEGTWDYIGLPGGSDGKAPACNAGDLGLIPGWGRSSGERNGNPLQYSCLESPMDGGAWRAAVHRVAKSWTQLSDFTLLYFNVSAVSNSSSVKRAL